MAKEGRPPILRDERYPGGWGVVLAWDVQVDGRLVVSNLLLRAGQNEFIVHRSLDDGTIREQVSPLDADAARSLYEHMTIHFGPFPDTTLPEPPLGPGSHENAIGQRPDER